MQVAEIVRHKGAKVITATIDDTVQEVSRTLRKGRCCCAVGMCENSRQRVIHVSTAVAVIFLRLQVALAVNDAAAPSPFTLTVHVSGGPAMPRAAVAASFRPASQNGGQRPLVIGVTVLTSFDEDDVEAVGMRAPLGGQVRRLARRGVARRM